MNKVIVCTAKYSDNLGDGVISDSVEYLIKSINPNTEVCHLDISGRVEYAKDVITKTPLSKKVFHSTPNSLKFLITLIGWHLKFKKRLRSRINHIDFKSADRLIFGGGQLISDIGLNFPLKVSYICKMAERANLDYSFNSIGVANNFSVMGRLLMKSVLHSQYMKMISVRDLDCVKHLLKFELDESDILKTVDTGLWASEAYQIVNNKEATNLIGIGISHPKELSAHADDFNSDNNLQFWVDLINGYIKAGYTPVLFTNGSFDDNSYYQVVLDELNTKVKNGYKAQALPTTPKELISLISKFDSIISHRLHANIVAHSLSIPSLALSWDKKVQSYCDLIGKEDWCINQSNYSVIDIIKRHQKIMEEGVDIEQINQLKTISRNHLKLQMEY